MRSALNVHIPSVSKKEKIYKKLRRMSDEVDLVTVFDTALLFFGEDVSIRYIEGTLSYETELKIGDFISYKIQSMGVSEQKAEELTMNMELGRL